ncbi:DUF4013 domain-containing protein [Salinigranum halophilum]|jgi:hypothetical protein|uniref:DUF4013 domain-containing protein n=1 Tax=Salinigranum halophilum TaxID=2565931 RepID=UPI0010A88FFF|nr:DUF4013 domain-containing protein [Salinigranum halophilum]
MLSDALSFPRRGDDWLSTLLVGGILTILGFLLLPAFVLQGYLVRVLNAAARGERTPPSFTQWGTLLVDGVKVFVVNLVYGLFALVPFVLLFAGLLVAVPSDPVPMEPAATPPPPPGSASGLVIVVLLVAVVAVVTLLLTYLVPAALANFAIEGRLGAAFALRTIVSGAFTSDYAVAWVLALVVGIVGVLVGAALSAVVVGVFVLFYVQVVFYYLVGRGFAAGLAKKRWTEP